MHSKRTFIKYCWKHSSKVAQIKNKGGISRLYYFFDMMNFGFKYNATTLDYMDLNYYNKNRKERSLDKVALIEQKNYRNRVDRERIILSKYSSPKYQNHKKWHKRLRVYEKTFNLGKNCTVQYDVWIRCGHNVVSSKFICGDKVKFLRHADIDYTGDLEIGNNVSITEGVKILTHNHDRLGLRSKSESASKGKSLHLTKLVIEDNVNIGTRAIIMPGVGRIGENSIISAGSIVRKRVPPNVIVAGNPAEIVVEFPAEKRIKK